MGDGEVQADKDLGNHDDVGDIAHKSVLVVHVDILSVERVVNNAHSCNGFNNLSYHIKTNENYQSLLKININFILFLLSNQINPVKF